jgi:hypothetical protein
VRCGRRSAWRNGHAAAFTFSPTSDSTCADHASKADPVPSAARFSRFADAAMIFGGLMWGERWPVAASATRRFGAIRSIATPDQVGPASTRQTLMKLPADAQGHGPQSWQEHHEGWKVCGPSRFPFRLSVDPERISGQGRGRRDQKVPPWVWSIGAKP